MSFYSSESTLLLPLFNLFILNHLGFSHIKMVAPVPQRKKDPCFYFSGVAWRGVAGGWTALFLGVMAEIDGGGVVPVERGAQDQVLC